MTTTGAQIAQHSTPCLSRRALTAPRREVLLQFSLTVGSTYGRRGSLKELCLRETKEYQQ